MSTIVWQYIRSTFFSYSVITRSNEQILTSDSHGPNPILPQSEQKLLTLIGNSLSSYR